MLPMKAILISALILLQLSIAGKSQAQQHPICGADELRISTLKEMPKVADAVARRQAELDRFAEQYSANAALRGGEPEVFTIPVVFHVIHQYGPENISDAQLKDGIRVCNATFRKTSPDTVIIVDAFKPIHADCGIEFRLATKDPDGNCHSGINRIASPLGATGDHAVKSLVHWDPTRYLNIYVVSNAAGLAGHALRFVDAGQLLLQCDGGGTGGHRHPALPHVGPGIPRERLERGALAEVLQVTRQARLRPALHHRPFGGRRAQGLRSGEADEALPLGRALPLLRGDAQLDALPIRRFRRRLPHCALEP